MGLCEERQRRGNLLMTDLGPGRLLRCARNDPLVKVSLTTYCDTQPPFSRARIWVTVF